MYSNELHNKENLNFCTDAFANKIYTFYFEDITILKTTLWLKNYFHKRKELLDLLKRKGRTILLRDIT